MYSAKSFGNSTLSCNVGSTRVAPKCPWIARKQENVRKNCGSRSTETFPFVLLLLSESLSNLELASANQPQTLTWTFLPERQISLLRLLLDELNPHHSNLIMNFGTDTEDTVEVGLGRFLAFATRLPVHMSPTLATRISSDVWVTYLLIPLTIRTQQVVCHEIKIRS